MTYFQDIVAQDIYYYSKTQGREHIKETRQKQDQKPAG